jgi:SNF2 family DNA or RNA helicase
MKIAISPFEGQASISPRGYLGPRFNDFRAAIAGAKFDGQRKLNLCALDKLPMVLKRLREAEFSVEVDPEIRASLETHTAQQWADLEAAKDRMTKVNAELGKRGLALFPFQRTGVTWLATRHGALLADEMGLGKTVQTLCALPGDAGVLVVCPAVAKGVWRRELGRFRPHFRVSVLSGRGSFRWPVRGEVVITNYDILPGAHRDGCKGDGCNGCAEVLSDIPSGTVVVADEAHALKNAKAQRTMRFRALSEGARRAGGRTWLLTATPLMNRPQELWAVYQAAGIAQEAFGSWKQFVSLFRGEPGQWGGYVWGIPSEESVERIKRVSLRRMKSEVASDIPAKSRNHLTVDVDAKARKACDAFVREIGKDPEEIANLLDSGVIPFEKFSAVRAALATAKVPALLELVDQYEEQEEPLVVFSAHRAPVDKLSEREGWAVISGDTPNDRRTEIEDAFQAGKLKGVACTIKAGGVAITLTKAANAIFVDRELTPALNAQAEDRIHRIGQARPATITILVADHLLDERISDLLTSKQALIEATVDEARERPNTPSEDWDAEKILREQQEVLKALDNPEEEVEEEDPNIVKTDDDDDKEPF